MVILGLTGSIGMGKTVAAGDFRRLGVPVHDSDAAVHALLAPGGDAVAAIAAVFPDTIREGGVDRQAMAARVFGDDSALERLEAIVHPLVRQRTQRFLAIQARRGAALVVLDVPLLFESGGDQRCDAVACVSAPPFVQRARVMRRPGMTAARLAAILARQMPDGEKRRRADFIIRSGIGRGHGLRLIRRIVKMARALPARHWPPTDRPHRRFPAGTFSLKDASHDANS